MVYYPLANTLDLFNPLGLRSIRDQTSICCLRPDGIQVLNHGCNRPSQKIKSGSNPADSKQYKRCLMNQLVQSPMPRNGEPRRENLLGNANLGHDPAGRPSLQ